MRIQNTLFIASLVGATLLVGAMALLMIGVFAKRAEPF